MVVFVLTSKYCRWWGLLAQLLTAGTQFNSSALLNGGTSAPLLAIYCWQRLIFKNMIQIIKDKSELRKGNIIFVDSIVIPPNFITAQPQMLGDGWEDCINKEWDNCAFLNAKEQYMKDLFGDVLEKNGVKVEQLEKEGFDTFAKWKMTFNGITKEVSFIHQVQNAYEDWTGERLI